MTAETPAVETPDAAPAKPAWWRRVLAFVIEMLMAGYTLGMIVLAGLGMIDIISKLEPAPADPDMAGSVAMAPVAVLAVLVWLFAVKGVKAWLYKPRGRKHA
ncbi:hypothetical protein [Methylocella sp.]|uniref:hypothetical protein n=1 Tax=Methylocella sp. TaxID=1978226 RepID=UPI0035AF26CD